MTRGLPHHRALDGLRGVAVVAVIAFHLGYLPGGYLGVDLFFTLSGFLITSLLLAEVGGSGTVSLRAFWARRARRLLPAVLALLALVPLYAAVWATPFERAGLRTEAFSTLFYVANWHQIGQGTEYWSRFSGPSPLQHTWSLAIEEQFYVLFPLLVLALARTVTRGGPAGGPRAGGPGAQRELARRLVVTATPLTALSAFLMIRDGVAPDADLSRLYFSTQTRFASILVGVVLAAVMVGRGAATGTARLAVHALSGVGAVVLGFAWALAEGTEPFIYRGGLLACAAAAGTLIVVAVQPGRSPLKQMLELGPLVWVGSVSYGLYLWHWPVFVVLTEERTGLTGLALVAVRVAVTLAFVVPSYYLLENPIRQRRLIATNRAPAVVLGAFVGVVALIFAGTSTTPPDLTTYLHPLSTAQPPPRVLIVGDSLPDSLEQALTTRPDLLGVEVRSLAQPACGVFPEVTRIRLLDGSIGPDGEGCAPLIASWPTEAQAFDPDVAILVLGFAGQLDREIDGRWAPVCDAAFGDSFRRHLGDALDALHGVVADVRMTTTAQHGAGPRRGERVDDVDCINRYYRDVGASRPWLRFIDLAGHVCPENDCLAAIDGVPLRPDGLHYHGPSSAIVGSWILQQALPPQGP